MNCKICGTETNGSIGGKDICPTCDCGIGIHMNRKTGKLESKCDNDRLSELLYRLKEHNFEPAHCPEGYEMNSEKCFEYGDEYHDPCLICKVESIILEMVI